MSNQPAACSTDFNRVVSKTGELFRKLKDAGYTIVVSGCVGGVPAMASGILGWSFLEHHRQLIDVVRTSSGSGIPYALATTGVSSKKIEQILRALKLRHFVEDIGLFAEHNQAEGVLGRINDIIAYLADARRTMKVILRNATDYKGIIQGDLMEKELEKKLPINFFGGTQPSFEVVASALNGFRPHIFSADTTPQISIASAVTASCSIYQVFKPRLIDGVEYVDGAEYEALPLRSVVESHLKKGLNPEKLFILGIFIHRAPRTVPTKRHMLAMDEYRSTLRHQNNFRDHLDDMFYDTRYRGVKHIILELDATSVVLPSPESFPTLWELGGTIRALRKLLAKLTHREEIERLWRGVSIFLYNELNPEHLPYYLDAFRPKLGRKLIEGISNFENHFSF